MKDKLTLAQEFAKRVHLDHLRISGETYYAHIQKTVNLLKEVGIDDETMLILAYLHHSKRLTNEQLKEVKVLFGEEIYDLTQKYNELRSNEIKHITANEVNTKLAIPTFLNLTKDMRLIILRLADKAIGIQTSHALPEDIRIKSAERAIYLYDPIAQLLGLIKFSHILQNEAFKVLNPAEYIRINKYVKKMLPKATKVLTEIEKFLMELLNENNVDSNVEWRIKNNYSIYKKLSKYNFIVENLYDIAALRILVNTIEDCYKAEDILKQLWPYIEKRRKDNIHTPRPSGYQSIHNAFLIDGNVPLEIQIKTHEMHEKNEFGHASHLIYKMGNVFLKKVKNDPELLKSLHYQRAEPPHLDSFSKNVYVFTPKGDIIELPTGSNLIDFAYAIHADLGNSCTGGIVNNQIKKLDYELKNGDRVEIKAITSRKKPSEDWLKMAKTRRARAFIRKALKYN